LEDEKEARDEVLVRRGGGRGERMCRELEQSRKDMSLWRGVDMEDGRGDSARRFAGN